MGCLFSDQIIVPDHPWEVINIRSPDFEEAESPQAEVEDLSLQRQDRTPDAPSPQRPKASCGLWVGSGVDTRVQVCTGLAMLLLVD